MAEAAISQRVAPFESASELREAHAHLLEVLDMQLGQDASEAGEAAALACLDSEIRQFLERGAATGVYLDEMRERTACQVLLDYWVSNLSQAGMHVASSRLARFDGEQLPDLKDKPCPYVGLEAFRDRTFFFGRESDIKTLLAQVRDAPLVLVLGASGSGKSSLVMGGVMPALAANGVPPALRLVPPCVPGNSVLDHLADVVLRGCGRVCADVAAEAAALRADRQHLHAMVGGAEALPTLITIDQFEEVFTLSNAGDREALVENLAELLAGGLGHRVILTMREEFRSRVVELSALSTYLDKAWYSMRPMGYEELKAAVERPAVLVNLQFQAGIVDDLVKKVLGQPAALPLLQFTLRSLWERRDRNRITWEVYRKIGDPLSALKASADQFYAGIAPQTQDEVRRVLLELVRVDDFLEAYRQPVPKSRLLKAGRANTEEVIMLLAENDYIRISPDAGAADAVVEVKHESLIRNWPLFVGWIDEKRIERRQRLALSQAAQRWKDTGRPDEGLLTGWQLQEAKGQSDLAGLEEEFITASAAAVDRMQREKEDALRREADQAIALVETKRKLLHRTKIALIIVALAAVAIAGAAGHYWLEQNTLEKEKTTLEIKNAKLEADKTKLQAAYNELFAKQVQQAVAPESHLPSRQPVTIFLHISAEDQRQRAEEIAQLLRKNNIAVPGIEKVKPVAHSSVRFFRKEDQLGALEIVRLLNDYLGVAAQFQLVPTLIKGFEKKVPGRRYEIWFASDALSPVKPDTLRQR